MRLSFNLKQIFAVTIIYIFCNQSGNAQEYTYTYKYPISMHFLTIGAPKDTQFMKVEEVELYFSKDCKYVKFLSKSGEKIFVREAKYYSKIEKTVNGKKETFIKYISEKDSKGDIGVVLIKLKEGIIVEVTNQFIDTEYIDGALRQINKFDVFYKFPINSKLLL